MFQRRGRISLGWAVVFWITVVSVACDVWAVIFLVRFAILRRFVYRMSQNGSKAVPRAIESSLYNAHVFVATVVRRLRS